MPVERIVVSGKLEHLRQEAVRDALAGELGDGLLVLDLPRAARASRGACPGSTAPSCGGAFPDTLEVRVVEQVPIARWGDDAFLNHEARIIEVVDATRWAKLPEIRGPEGSEARLMRHYQQLRLDLAPIALRPVALREDDFGQLRATLDNGGHLQLGDHAFRGRVQRLVKLWARELAQAPAPSARVDLRYERGAAVAFASCPRKGSSRTRRTGRIEVAALINTRGRGRQTMAGAKDRRMIVGLDIGTSKVVAIVGEVAADGSIEVVGIGSHPSKGMKKGVVVNIESTVQSIQRAVDEAELMAGCQIHSVYAGIAGSHIRSLNSHGIVAIKEQEVVGLDLERVLDAARAVAIPADQKVLHVLPQEYVIDNQEGIKEPQGMSGVRLEAKVHLVTCAVNAAQNIEKCIRRCGLEVEDIILEQLASSYSVLTDDERELGVCLVDIGGGTTDIAIFTEGRSATRA
jgi:cell division septal protein FtsQ/Ethanolamine utilization protein EutJ (predicted chaperonin)